MNETFLIHKDIVGKSPTAVLVAVNTAQQQIAKTYEYLDELEFLAVTLDIKTTRRFVQNLNMPHGKTYIGKGKLEEIKSYIKAEEIKCAIFDDELTPSQVKNLEIELECEILDRTLLIFKIFAMRAQTTQAKIQVELAQYQYLLPRLTRMWSHLSRQQGGGANMRGPGEKELETDKRIAQDKISSLKERLHEIEKQSLTQRKKRNDVVKVSLVGYTNVGKSTLMNVLSKANVFAENKLFATLDPTVRKVVINDTPFLLSDTVGFIRKLPHSLVECFKSTLDQVRESHLLIHVVDISHASYKDHLAVVLKTLKEIGAGDIPIITVFNKIDDLLNPEQEIVNIDATLLNIGEHICISAKNDINIDQLKTKISDIVYKEHIKIYPFYKESGVFSEDEITKNHDA